MDVSSSSWLVILLAFAAANLPFFNDKVFALIPLKSGGAGQEHHRKALFIRLLEMVVLYFVVGLIAMAIEARIGTRFPQQWEFYAITACLFIVLAFPGFVVRYLRKRR
ncbi:MULTISPECIES: DUF2818 family protein [unclassified Massilia]|uniref:DUF2818 family protein n=1 Tax=unclassified Massilia TaxID=2609279 RepID=UPI001592E848|nr:MULTISPECIES: DUF2818 family protein [unclassified Massilia]NVD98782.1 DUF2818 family protein [Massilia sp. BJB1822]UTY58714.1 DUF2818 family protein [Massilia sp. erpn]